MNLLQTLHRRLDLLAGKYSTGYFTDQEKDDAINSASVDLYNKYYKEYEATQVVSDYLSPFTKKPLVLNVGQGVAAKPVDFGHPTVFYLENDGPNVEIVDRAAWAHKINDKTFGPTEEYPIAKINADTIDVRPKAISKLIVEYLKTPKVAIFNRDGEGNYNPDTSVDLEWDPILQDQLLYRALQELGIMMRESELIQVAQIEKQQENS